MSLLVFVLNGYMEKPIVPILLFKPIQLRSLLKDLFFNVAPFKNLLSETLHFNNFLIVHYVPGQSMLSHT